MPSAENWIIGGPGWIRYRTLLDLQGKVPDSGAVVSARLNLVKDPQVAGLIKDLADWPGPALTRHNDAGHPLHKLVFLADLGLHRLDFDMEPVVEKILGFQKETGEFDLLLKTSAARGGTGSETRGWMLCDWPSVVYSLAKMGLRQDKRLLKSAEQLAGLAGPNGWPCTVSAEMGRFRGPGKKSDPCPYATLLALKALAQFPQYVDHPACHTGAAGLLELWEQRKERKMYLFAMGTDFAKLKAPLIWFDILHVTEVLTQFPWLINDPRLQEMLDLVETRADDQGLFTAGSVWKAWAGWDFGQKKTPSYWITFLVNRLLKRAGRL